MAVSGALDGGSPEQVTAGTEGGNNSNRRSTERMTAVVQGREIEGMTAETEGGIDEREQGVIEGGIGVSAGVDGEKEDGSSSGINKNVDKRSVQISRSTCGHARESSSSSSSSSSSLDVRGAKRRRTGGRAGVEGGEEGQMENLLGSHGGCEAGSENLIKVVEWGKGKEEGDADESGAEGCSQREGVRKERLDEEKAWFAPMRASDARGEQGRERDAKGDFVGAPTPSSSARGGGGGIPPRGWLAKLKRSVDTSKAVIEDIEGDEGGAKRLRGSNG